MTVNIIIDKREVKLIKYFQQNNIKFKSLMLDLGDIIIEYNSNINTEENNIFKLIIERKTLSDLFSSLKDGRYREQKTRLLSLYGNDKNIKLCYILEGKYNNSCSYLHGTLSQIHGCLISMLFRDDIYVMNTSTLEESYELILQLRKRILKNVNDFFNVNDNNLLSQKTSNPKDNSNNNDSTVKKLIIDTSTRGITHHSLLNNYVKSKKQDNITENNCASLMLSYIPGVSIKTSSLIMNEYNNSIVKLCHQIVSDSDSVIYKLSELKHNDSNRRLGKKLAERIVLYLNNSNNKDVETGVETKIENTNIN